MRRVWVVIVVMVALGLGLAWYRGWYTLSRNESSTGNQVDLRLTIDKDRVKSDTAPRPATPE